MAARVRTAPADLVDLVARVICAGHEPSRGDLARAGDVFHALSNSKALADVLIDHLERYAAAQDGTLQRAAIQDALAGIADTPDRELR